jgi:hypothetical protein
MIETDLNQVPGPGDLVMLCHDYGTDCYVIVLEFRLSESRILRHSTRFKDGRAEWSDNALLRSHAEKLSRALATHRDIDARHSDAGWKTELVMFLRA